MTQRVGAMINTIFAARNLEPQELLDFVRVGEEGGLESFWVGDHVNWYVPVLECMTTLAFLAGNTGARLGSNVVIPALRQPVLLAKMAATIDYLAPGGFELGIGVGGEHLIEYEAADVPVRERGARTDEAIDLLRRLFREDGVSHEGRFYRTTGVTIAPRRDLPILIGGRSDPAFRRVVERGDGWTAAWVTPSQFERMRGRIVELAEERGRDVTTLRTVVHVFCRISEPGENPWEIAGQYLADHYGVEDVEPFRKFCALGTPEQVLGLLDGFVDAGVDELLVSFLGSDPCDQMERFVAGCAPQLLARVSVPEASP